MISLPRPERPQRTGFPRQIGMAALGFVGPQPLGGGTEADAVYPVPVIETEYFYASAVLSEYRRQFHIRKRISIGRSLKGCFKHAPLFYRSDFSVCMDSRRQNQQDSQPTAESTRQVSGFS